MENTIYLMHSGSSIADTNPQHWETIERSLVNPFDAPLSEEGIAQMKKAASKIEQLDAIYCSPTTRSIESALILKQQFDVPVRVEYGLAESPILSDFAGVVAPKFINGTFVKLVPNHLKFKGKSYYTLFDEALLSKALFAKYPDLDSDYTPLYLPQQIPFSEDDCSYGNRMIKVMNSLALNGKNIAFIGHKGTVTLAAVYLRKELQNLPKGDFFQPPQQYLLWR
jgi:broad specificity phosphatase PhoE